LLVGATRVRIQRREGPELNHSGGGGSSSSSEYDGASAANLHAPPPERMGATAEEMFEMAGVQENEKV